MIDAGQFVGPARHLGFDFWAGVPCSLLTPLINNVSGDDQLTYVSSANEGDAVAVAAGAVLGGRRCIAMMQNSGLGNAVSPLSSLNHVFHIPVLLIITLRGDPDESDEPQHQLMGQITTQLLETLRIPWSWFPDCEDEVETTLNAVTAEMDETDRPYALIMRKGMVSPCPLKQDQGFDKLMGNYHEAVLPVPPTWPTRNEILRELVACTDVSNTLLIASTGFTGRELYAIEDRSNQLYMVGSMGCASALGLGLSMVRPDWRIVVIDGDGAALMRLGNVATAGAYGGSNFYHLLLDNRVHESTGGQATISSTLDFPAIAFACGYQNVYRAHGSRDLGNFLDGKGTAFMHIQTDRGVPEELPRPAFSPVDVAHRLQRHMGVRS